MSEQLTRQANSRGHMPGCPHHGEAPPTADENSTHVDLFCDCHDWKEPRILANGTDVAWPAGWTDNQASEWRRRNNLMRQSEPGAGP
jgi:hypothetical protein